MFHRIFEPGKKHSFFLFGARGTGKSTLLRNWFKKTPSLYIDLLDPEEEEAFLRNPGELKQRLDGLPAGTHWIILDEIQKIPRLLDAVHAAIENRGMYFALTGSSARKLKRGEANMLAGRAFIHHLFPLTHLEIGEGFALETALHFGTLPKVLGFEDSEDKIGFLKAYSLTYLKEEIAAEQLVRKLQPFRGFLEVAAQCNGQILNFSRISREVGADVKTVQGYFEILEDTLMGFLLPAFHESVRKRQSHAPKFYFFDTGVKRALERTLTQNFGPGTYAYGNAFEHFLILEIFRLSSYSGKDWKFSYLRTKDGVEIDLIVERPGLPKALVEIKSKDRVSAEDVAPLERLARDMPKSEAFCLSRDLSRKRIGSVSCLPWRDGLRELGLGVE